MDMDSLQPDVKGNRARDRKAQPENNSKLVCDPVQSPQDFSRPIGMRDDRAPPLLGVAPPTLKLPLRPLCGTISAPNQRRPSCTVLAQVLIFFILVIATYTAIVSHRFHMREPPMPCPRPD